MTKPRNKRIRPQKATSTVLAIGEGATEFAFLSFLRRVFTHPELKITIKRLNPGGGSPNVIVGKAVKHDPDQYDSAFVLLDTDIEWPPNLHDMAAKYNLHLIGTTPCIEALLLDIIEPQTKRSGWSTAKCKRHFHRNYLDQSAKLATTNYERILPRDSLLAARRNVATLSELFDRMFLGKV